MKQFLAFMYEIYEQSGGMNDLLGDYDTLDEAIVALDQQDTKTVQRYQYHGGRKWKLNQAHVYDTEQRAIVWTDAEIKQMSNE